MDKVGVLIVEDERLMRQVLRVLLADEADLSVVGDTGDAREAVSLARRLQPEVVLMDINLSRAGEAGDGIAATREILQWAPRSSVVILTGHAQEDFLFAAFRAGARSYLLKTCPVDEMVRAVRAAARGESWVHPAMARYLARLGTDGPWGQEARYRPLLTERELQVLGLLARGASNREIACCLFLSEKTVKRHVSGILKKLKLRSRAEAALYAVRNGLAG